MRKYTRIFTVQKYYKKEFEPNLKTLAKIRRVIFRFFIVEIYYPTQLGF